MSRSLRLGAAFVIVAAGGGVAKRAEAGAPNYECSIGRLQIGIDQHRRAGLARVRGGPVDAMPFVDTDQNGSSLLLSAKISGVTTHLAIAQYGEQASSDRENASQLGRCAFIPGDFVLGQVSANLLVMHRDPEDGSPVVARIKPRSLVWSSGRYDEVRREVRGTDAWAKFRVVLVAQLAEDRSRSVWDNSPAEVAVRRSLRDGVA